MAVEVTIVLMFDDEAQVPTTLSEDLEFAFPCAVVEITEEEV